MDRFEQMMVRGAPRALVNLASRARADVRHRIAERTFGPKVELLLPDATSHHLVSANADAVVFRVEATAGPMILKLANTPDAQVLLAAEADALDEIDAMESLADWRSLVAKVGERGAHERGTWISQSVVPGVPTLTGEASNQDPDLNQIIERAGLALGPLHEATSVTGIADEQVLDQVVSNPITTVKKWRPRLAPHLTAINGACRQRLASLDLVRARSHGDYAPSNVLWDNTSGAVSGIVDWRLDQTLLPPEVDYVHFALTTQIAQNNQEFGRHVEAILTGGESAPGRLAVENAVALGPNNLDLRTALTLAWLHHVAFGLDKARQLRRNPIWLGNNVDAVAHALQPG